MDTSSGQYSITDIAWAAGLFEGEGSIHANSIKKRRYLMLNLSSTDEDVVRKFAAVIGCGKVYGPYYEKSKPGKKPRFSWHTKSKADGIQAASLLEPFLCERRLAKLQAVRALVEAQPAPKTGWGIGVSDERRKALSERMKRYWAEGRYDNRRPKTLRP
jgi:hypothetical protein